MNTTFLSRFRCISYLHKYIIIIISLKTLINRRLSMPENSNLRIQLGAANTLEEFNRITNVLKDFYEPYHQGKIVWENSADSLNLILPPWLCQPYIRINPEEHMKKVEENQQNVSKRHFEDNEGNQISRKKMKRLRRINRRPQKPDGVQIERYAAKCELCANPIGRKCEYKMCKKCCKNRCFLENLDCPGHKVLVKTRREMAQYFAEQKTRKIIPPN